MSGFLFLALCVYPLTIRLVLEVFARKESLPGLRKIQWVFIAVGTALLGAILSTIGLVILTLLRVFELNPSLHTYLLSMFTYFAVNFVFIVRLALYTERRKVKEQERILPAEAESNHTTDAPHTGA